MHDEYILGFTFNCHLFTIILGAVDIYHEKQSRQLCALHSLNNLFQQPGAFRKKDLDTICYKLVFLYYPVVVFSLFCNSLIIL